MQNKSENNHDHAVSASLATISKSPKTKHPTYMPIQQRRNCQHAITLSPPATFSPPATLSPPTTLSPSAMLSPPVSLLSPPCSRLLLLELNADRE